MLLEECHQMQELKDEVENVSIGCSQRNGAWLYFVRSTANTDESWKEPFSNQFAVPERRWIYSDME